MTKKIAVCVFIFSLIVFLIAWGVMGLKIFARHDYDITALAYVGAACLPFIFGSLLVFRFIDEKCPHCGKLRTSSGEYCPHCGKKIEK